MLTLAIILGTFGYGIYFLGLLGWLYPQTILIWVFCNLFFLFRLLPRQEWLRDGESQTQQSQFNRYITIERIILFLLFVTSLVNFIGALGPELAFDALWYHLTLAKLYVLHHAVIFIPGNLLYYSAMPRLGEMYFTASLLFSNEIFAKIIHFTFGLLVLITTYLIGRKFLNQRFALLATLIMSTNLVFAWESTTAYIDLFRAFFEVTGLLSFITWVESHDRKYLLITGFLVGCALGTKLLAIGSVVVFGTLIIIYDFLENEKRRMMADLVVYILPIIILFLPWVLFSYHSTGSLFYPFFPTQFSVEAGSSINLFIFFKDTWTLLTHADDPISPMYVITLPLVLLLIAKDKLYITKNSKLLILVCYCIATFLYWYAAPHIGQARYILPYLPAWSILSAIVISKLQNKHLQYIFIGIVIFISVLNSGYRLIANARYIQVILGKETKQDFLTSHLNFSYGDFVDSDGYFRTHIKSTDKVLLIGFHNLYYVDFPFIHASWRQSSDTFNYVATQNTQLPNEFKSWRLVYENSFTHVKLYNK